VLIQVPYAVLEPAGGQLSYQVSVKVTDGQGLSLLGDAWRNHAPASARVPGAYGLDMIDFAVAPGAYQVAVEVQDSVSGRQLGASVPVEGFTAMPPASDLMLASSMRVADASDTVPRAGEVRRGNVLFHAAARLRLTPLRTSAYYMLEAYNAGPETSGTMTVAVLDRSGAALMRTPESPVRIGEGGGLLKGHVDLEGLPPGAYQLSVSVKTPTGTFERNGEMVMASLEETLVKDTVRIAAEKVGDEGYFRYMDPLRLDSAFAPIAYVAEPGELRSWDKGLSDDAKRKFLTDFWGRRDPTPGTPRNEVREQFYAGIEFANRNYSERRVPGWKTDRGRIYAKYGAPDDMLQRYQEQQAPPYECWRYTRGKARWFIFADLTRGLGQQYRLMQSNDLSEVNRSDWRQILTEDGVRDCGRFIGQDFYGGAPGL